MLGAQLEQTGILLQDVSRRPREVIVDLGALAAVAVASLGMEWFFALCALPAA